MTFENNAKLKNVSILDWAQIKLTYLNSLLNIMLLLSAFCATLTLTIILIDFVDEAKPFVAILTTASATGIILYFLVNRYIENISYRFEVIDKVHMNALSTIAKKFFRPLVICMAANIFLSVVASLTYFLYGLSS